MCCVNAVLSGRDSVCVPVQYFLLALHVSSTDQHSVPEAFERLWNGTETQMRQCLLSDQKLSPVLNGLFVPRPPSCLLSHISQQPSQSLPSGIHFSASMPPPLLFTSSGEGNYSKHLLVKSRWKTTSPKWHVSHSCLFPLRWKEASVFFPLWEHKCLTK